ncbi:hypothetical protein Tco_0950929 [Tanacetum coccineum]|uniref:Uncharacterized protein n=1 Tax=Tanacetum coccineum TaxID=301880 RepID=A0ABQ5DTM1_9ASTR
MAESSSHNTSSPEITPKEEPVTLINPQNQRLLLQSLSGVRGDIGITTFRNALRAQYLPHSSMYVSPPSITTVRPWFATIGYNGEIRAKGTLKKSCLPPRWRLLMGQIILVSRTSLHVTHDEAIWQVDVPVGFQSLQNFLTTESSPKAKNPGAKSRLRRKQSSKHTSESQTEASKSKTGQSEIETKSSLTKDKSLSHPSPPTLVVGEMHKEAQQAAGGPTSLGATSEEGAHPQLSSEIKELKQHVKDMEIELHGDLKEIPTKLETFISTISSLTSQVSELKNIQWELPAEPQALPILVSSVQKQLKTLDSLPNLLNKVTETLNRFATVVENASEATTKDVPSAGQATASPAEGEKNTKDAETNLKDELVDLLGTNVCDYRTTSMKLLLINTVTRC